MRLQWASLSRFLVYSVGAGQAENLRGDEAGNHVVAHRRDLVHAGLAKFAFDVVGVDEAVSAVRVEADVRCGPARFGGEKLGHVRLGAAGLPGVEQAMITGLVFGTIFAITGRIWMVMCAHAAFDLAAVAIIYWNLETTVAHLVFK